MVSKQGIIIRLSLNKIPSQGRTTQGVYLMRLSGNDIVASTSVVDAEIIDGKSAEPAEEPAEQDSLVQK
jgi:DNA gyrase/topoisomerase IV subunit A